MSNTPVRIVVIGAGHAGVELAAKLRTHGFDGDIALLDKGAHEPYELPPLSKAFLHGERELSELALRSDGYYAKHRITLRKDAEVIAVDRTARTVVCADGSSVEYDKLVFAMGSAPRRLAIPGAELPGVFHLASVEDSAGLREAFTTATSVVIVGGGFIGLEVAAAAVEAGCRVTVVEVQERLMKRALSAPMAATLQARHKTEGVEFIFGSAVTEIVGGDAVRRVMLSTGAELRADVVLIGIGAEAASGIAAAAGVAVERGIIVDSDCRTNDPDIFAIGDVSQAWSPLAEASIRLECVQNAVNQATIVAATLVDSPNRPHEVPWFWSDQYDAHVKMVGVFKDTDEMFLRGDPMSLKYSVGFLRDGVLVALETVNSVKDFVQAKKLVASNASIHVELASNPAVPLGAAERSKEKIK